ncbi:MAG TPA: ABC transporter substrate-binding protein [candidate division Zixibacteria bacterium]|nr:ABC transporter substrate-binding protein [candidate division Zixibacteria bacterium]
MAVTRLKITGMAAMLCALAAFVTVPVRAAERPRDRLRIVYAGLSGNQAPAWAALEGGFFGKHGVDAELVHVVGGTSAVRTLLSGDAAFAQVSGLPVIESALSGSEVVILAGLLNTMSYQFIVAREIARPAHLKGKTVAVSRLGSSSDFATRYALDRYGLVPGKDVRIVEIGAQPERFAALVNGKIQGVMLEVPLTLKARQMGFPVLADLQKLGLEYQATVLAATRTTVKTRPDLVRRVLTGIVEGIHYYKTRPPQAMAILKKYLKTSDAGALQETYESIGLALIPEKPYPTLRGIQVILRELSDTIPQAQSARPEQFVNSIFMRDLDGSGFIDRLYNAEPRPASPRK